MLVLAINYDKWAVVYMCTTSPSFRIREEFVWIMSRTPTLAEQDLKDAKDALTKQYPNFDMSHLELVPQDSC